jgi:hypothetical protein
MNRRRLIVVLTILAVFVSSAPSNGQFSLDTKIYVDEPTRKLIDAFPKDVHDQVLDAATKMSSMLNDDINGYLTKMNDLVERQLLNTQCTATGIAENLGDVIVNKAIRIKAKPIGNFTQDQASTISSFTLSKDPLFLATSYGDLTYRGMLTYCALKPAGVQENVEQFENKFRRLDFLWLSLIDKCDNAPDCVKKAHSETKDLIANSDKRDVARANGAQQLAGLYLPAEPDPGVLDRVHEYFYPPNFDIKPYEAALTMMQNIQQQIGLARLDRQILAAQAVAEAAPLPGAIGDQIRAAQVALAPHRIFSTDYVDGDQVRTAQKYAVNAEALYAQAKAALTKAEDLDDAGQGTTIRKIYTDLNATRADIDNIKSAQPYKRDNGMSHNATTDVQKFPH